MGIRFHCPNGHKLNVKEFLVGKRGICPDCDARFIVPESSGLVAVPVDAADDSATPPAAPQVVPSAPLSTAEQNLPDSWYVRFASGEQYGPASDKQMQAWATEGRIATDSLVWRTGWEQWKAAREVLDAFQATPLESSSPDQPTDSPNIELEPQPPVGAISPRSYKSRSENRRKRARKLSFVLGTVLLLLATILVIVLWFQN